MSDNTTPERARESVLPPASTITQVAVYQVEEEEPEPLSFAPSRVRRQSEVPPSSRSAALGPDFEAVSARFRSLDATRRIGQARAIRQDAQRLIGQVSDELRQRSLMARSAPERARLIAFAESVDKVVESPVASAYLQEEQVARELVTYLRRYRAAQRAYGNIEDLSEIILKASVTAIHLAPCLGYWRSNQNVPAEVKELLTAERVFGSVFRIAKERKSVWLDRLLGRYAAVTGDLKGAPGKHGPLPIKTRNPILWPWCRFNIRNVAYRLYRRDASMAADEDVIDDVKVALVLLNVLLDDLADAVQDAELLAPFLAIPFAGGGFGVATPDEYAALRSRLGEIGWPQFEAYFDLAVDTWKISIEKLKQVVGKAYEALEDELALNHRILLKAMQFSADLNERPEAIFALGPAAMKERYLFPTFGEILAHNANRAVFFTIDKMFLRAFDPERYTEIVAAGAMDLYRQNAWIYQDAHQTGNSVATGARELESDDITNELFKIANDRLNSLDDWPLSEHLAKLPGFPRRDAVLAAFARKKELKRAASKLPAGSPEHAALQREYTAFGEDIELMVDLSGAEHAYFQHWLKRREEAIDVLYNCEDWMDRYTLHDANDLVMVLHLLYKGRI